MGERSGERWSASEYARVVDALCGGAAVEDIASVHARTPGAIRAAMARMIPAEENVRRSDAEAWLRGELADGSYDWETVLRTRLAADGTTYWGQGDDDALVDAWNGDGRLAELAVRFQVGETAVARRLLELGLAESYADVVERLGAGPGGIMELRYALAREAESARLHILVGILPDGGLHVSAHPSPEAAEAVREDLQGQEGGGLVRWAIAARTPGGMTGPTCSSEPAWSRPGNPVDNQPVTRTAPAPE